MASAASNEDYALLDPSHGHSLERPDCDWDVDVEICAHMVAGEVGEHVGSEVDLCGSAVVV